MTIQEQIIKLVESNSSQEFEGDEDGKTLHFTTRENGDVGAEEYSQIDFDDATNIMIKVMAEFNHLIFSYEVNTCDEWVNLEIILN